MEMIAVRTLRTYPEINSISDQNSNNNYSSSSSTHENPQIFVVDDDHITSNLIYEFLSDLGYSVKTFASCEDFLGINTIYGDSCLILDINFPGMSGVDLLSRLSASTNAPMTIVVSGKSGISEAVRSMKLGAFDFLEKPIQPADLVESVKKALEISRRRMDESKPQMVAIDQIATLTRRQRQIMDLVVAGRRNKHIAAELGVSQRTVENHRAAIMAKLGAKSIPALTLTALSAMAPV